MGFRFVPPMRRFRESGIVEVVCLCNPNSRSTYFVAFGKVILGVVEIRKPISRYFGEDDERRRHLPRRAPMIPFSQEYGLWELPPS